MTERQTYPGWDGIGAYANDYNAMVSLILSLISQQATMALVQVKSVTGGGISTPAVVSVQPLVHQVDGNGAPWLHGIIGGLPCYRMQGGPCAVVVDPVVGDIGMAVFAMRDISVVKKTLAPSLPGSRRMYDWSDGVYVGALLGVTPTSFVQVSPGGINITSTSGVTVAAPSVIVNSTAVQLGAAGGKKVVLDGDPVVSGAVVASSTKVRAT